MESKKQLQSAELIKRNFGIVLQQEGSNIYGGEPFVTVTSVKVTPDLSLAKIYLSVYNIENKLIPISKLNENQVRMRQSLAFRVKKHIRRVPQISFYLDDTLDEMYKLNSLFDKLEDENQLGSDQLSPEGE